MKAGGALVLTATPGQAARRAVDEARTPLGGLSPRSRCCSPRRTSGSATELVTTVAELTGGVPLIGCVASAVAGGAREVESGPAVSLWLAAGLGPVETFGMEFVPTSGGGAFGGYRFGPDPAGAHLMICDPYTFPAADLMAHLNQNVPGAMVMGGMASGGLAQRRSLLFRDDRVLTAGAVGAHLPGAAVRPLVAQGCRPVGDPYTVTRADGGLIFELGGRPPLARLRELAATLPAREQELLAQGPHLGLVIDEYQAEARQGDFLVRGIVGADPTSGAMAVAGEVEIGQTVQFHVRDARSADEDLRRVLEREGTAGPAAARPPGPCCSPAPAAARACSASLTTTPGCWRPLAPGAGGGVLLRRGTRAGGGQNFLHTFTASIALFPDSGPSA